MAILFFYVSKHQGRKRQKQLIDFFLKYLFQFTTVHNGNGVNKAHWQNADRRYWKHQQKVYSFRPGCHLPDSQIEASYANQPKYKPKFNEIIMCFLGYFLCIGLVNDLEVNLEDHNQYYNEMFLGNKLPVMSHFWSFCGSKKKHGNRKDVSF